MGEPRSLGGAEGGELVETKTLSSGATKKPSYSDMARRKFPNIIIDLVAGEDRESKRLSYGVIADIIFDFLKLKKSEFARFQTFREEDKRHTLKIRTTKDIDVKKRYGAHHKFEVSDKKEGVIWKASIRGGGEEPQKEKEKTLKLRVFNPPEEATFEEVKEEIEKFAEVRSRIIEEVVSVEEEPRLAGFPIGVLHLWIKDIPKVPSFITVRRQRVRIRVALPPNVCLKCRKNGHRIAECNETNDTPEDNSANGKGTEEPSEMSEERESDDEMTTEIGRGEIEKVEYLNEEGKLPAFELLETDVKHPKKNGPTVAKPIRGGASRGRVKRDGLRSTS